MTTTVFLYDSGGTPHAITGETLSVDLRAGRDTERDVFDPGGGTIRVKNISRNFDPFFATVDSFLLQEDGASKILQESGDRLLLDLPGTAYGSYGAMVQGLKVIVEDGPFGGETVIFVGYVEDFEYVWEPSGYAEATLVVRDALATLGRTTYLEHTRTENQYTGDRITEMLDRAEVSFPALPRDIATGVIPCQGDTVSFGTNVLNDLQNIAKTEFGRLYVARNGVLTFLNRYAVFGSTSSATFNDTGSGLPFSGVGVQFGSESLFFTVSVERLGGVVQTATNSAAITANPNLGARHLAMSGLLFTSDSYSYSLATYLADRYSDAEAIIGRLDIPISRLSEADRTTVCALDIGDVITLQWTPTGSGGTLTQILAIEGWTYRASDGGKDAWMSYQLSDARDPEFLIYDTDSYDSGKVYGF